ncbi:MAG: ParB N-terminal domain-containing protein [Pseudomonadota bacterium]
MTQPVPVPNSLPRTAAAVAPASDLSDWHDALVDGRVLQWIPLDDIHTDDLPRDRLDPDALTHTPELAQLVASLRDLGQQQPITLYRAGGALQLKKGWRRLAALSMLHAETGDARFATVLARIEPGMGGREDGRLYQYAEMVADNLVRQDLSYADLAGIAIKAAADERCGDHTPDGMVTLLFESLSKAKRSHVRSFVAVLSALGPDLRFARDVPRDLGLKVARAIRKRPEDVDPLRQALAACDDAKAQNRVLRAHVTQPAACPEAAGSAPRFVAEPGALLIEAGIDFSTIDPAVLAEAVRTLCDQIVREGLRP